MIAAPSSAGARNVGQERAPAALATAGLAEALRSAGVELEDLGSLPQLVFTPDPLAPRSQNLPLVAAVAQMVAERVKAVPPGTAALVIGGDCTVTLGVVAGALHHSPSVGLVYFDADLDMNVPEESPSGILDGMVLAHLLGQGADALCRIGPRFPLLRAEEVVAFAYNMGSGYVDASERRRFEASTLRRYPVASVRGRPRAAAREALASFPASIRRIFVHFDVDVLDCDDFPAADLLHNGGLTLAEAAEALRVFVATPRFAGLVITEFNAARDPDRLLAERLVKALAGVFSPGARPDGAK